MRRTNLGFADWIDQIDALQEQQPPNDDGFSLTKLLDQAPALVRDLYIAKETGDAQAKLLEINLERARRGQPPLDMSAYSPHALTVGVAPQTQRALGVGTVVIGAAILGAVALASRRSTRSR
jgi:hypothetical protein